MTWFYAKDGQQLGPVSEEQLRSLSENGELSSDDLIWKEGMADWASFESVFGDKVSCPTCGSLVSQNELIPAGDTHVCPNCRDSYAQGLKEGLSKPVPVSGARGTGGKTTNAELRAMAREALDGNWSPGVLATFVLGIINQVMGFVPLIGLIAQYLLSGPFNLGLTKIFQETIRDHHSDVGVLFQGFSRFFQGVGVWFISTVILSLTSSLAAIPGAIVVFVIYNQNPVGFEEDPLFFVGLLFASVPFLVAMIHMYLRFSMVYFIANDNPEMGVIGIVKESNRMMDGFKMKLFILYVSFIGWHILGALALLIGLLFSTAYMRTTVAGFYDDIQEG